MRISYKLLGISEVVLLVTVVKRLEEELIEHCNGPSRNDDVTILCVDRL